LSTQGYYNFREILFDIRLIRKDYRTDIIQVKASPSEEESLENRSQLNLFHPVDYMLVSLAWV